MLHTLYERLTFSFTTSPPLSACSNLGPAQTRACPLRGRRCLCQLPFLMLACMLHGNTFGCCQTSLSSCPSSLKPALFLRRTSTPTLVAATASPTTLAVEREAASLQLDALLSGRWPAPAVSPDAGFILPNGGVGNAAVNAALHFQAQTTAVQQVSAEISRLLTEIDKELDAFVTSTSAYSPPLSRPPQPHTLSPSRVDSSHLRPVASPFPGDPQPSGSGLRPSGLPNPAAAGAFDPLALAGTQPAARPAGLLSQLSLTLPATQPQADSKNAAGHSVASDAGSRAERRRQKLRRSITSAAAEHAGTQEAKFKTNGIGSLSILMGSFSKDHILNAEEEKLLASAAQDFMQLAVLRRLLGAVLKRPPSMAEMAKSLRCDEASLRVRLDCGNRARTLLAQKNYRLVVSIAKRMVRTTGAGAGGGAPRGAAAAAAAAAGGAGAGGGGGSAPVGDNGVSLDDAITVGMEALMYAIRKFKPEAGYRLSTYATWWIRLHVSRLVQAQAGVVTLTTYRRAKLDRVRSIRARLRAELPPGTDPSRQQIADASGLSVAQVAEMEALERATMAGTRSFEAPLSDGEMLEDLVAQDHDSDVAEGMGSSLQMDSEDFAASASMAAAVEGLLSSLDSHESELLRHKYGLMPQVAGAEEDEMEEGAEAAEAQLRAQLQQMQGAGRGGWDLDGGAEAESGAMGKESGASRLKLGRKRRLSAGRALEKLRLSADDDSRLAEWLDLKSGRANLASRTTGYGKKSR